MLSAISACSTTPVITPTVTVLWAGTYTVAQSALASRDDSTRGVLSHVKGETLKREATDITALIDEHFGVQYVLNSEELGIRVPHHVIWRFPGSGLQDPRTGRQIASEEWDQTCRTGTPCLAGYVFNFPSELMPGDWSVEVLVGQTSVLKQSFRVTVK